MTRAGTLRSIARRRPIRRNTKRLRRIGRAGYVAYGVIHLLIAWLAVQIALGRPTGSASPTGAMRQFAGGPLGRALLLLLTAGLGLLVLWKVGQVVFGVYGKSGGNEAWLRVVAAIQAAVFGVLAVSAARVAAGSGGSSGDGTKEHATAGVLGLPGGPFLVGLAGAAVLGVGVGLIVYGVVRRFTQGMDTSRLSPAGRRVVVGLGAVGYAAKGVAYGIVGGLLIAAAATRDPDKSGGLDSALRTLAAEPYGRVLLAAVAAGLAAFGAFCLTRTRHQRR